MLVTVSYLLIKESGIVVGSVRSVLSCCMAARNVFVSMCIWCSMCGIWSMCYGLCVAYGVLCVLVCEHVFGGCMAW